MGRNVTTDDEFLRLLKASLQELKIKSEGYEGLLTELGKLRRPDSDEIDVDALESSLKLFEHFPHLGSARAAKLVRNPPDPLKSTRKLLVEIQNRVIALNPKK